MSPRRKNVAAYVYVCPKCDAEVSTDIRVVEVKHRCRSHKNAWVTFKEKQ